MVYFYAIVVLLLMLNPIRRPEVFFWVCMTVFSDPGGYLYFYLYNFSTGFIKPNEVFFFMAFLPLLSPKYKLNEIKEDKYFMYIFYALIVFMIYYILIYGYFTPVSFGKSNFYQFIRKQRLSILSVFIMIPAYLVTKRNIGFFIKLTTFISVIVLTLFIISMSTGLNLVPWVAFDRYIAGGIVRKTLYSWGFMDLMIPISLVLFIFKIKTKYNNYIFLGGILMVVTLFLTITRQMIVIFWFQIILILILAPKFFKVHMPNVISKTIISIVIIILSLNVFAPGYFEGSFKAFDDIYSLATVKTNSAGQEEQRLTEDIPMHLAFFDQNPLFGVGYDYNWYGANDVLDSGSTDTPITAALAMFGIIGLLMYFPFYIFVLYTIYSILNYCRKIKRQYVNEYNTSLDYLMLIVVILLFLPLFTIKIPALFVELVVSDTRVLYIFQIGILLGCFYNIRQKVEIAYQKRLLEDK